jgi:hypothetical protein
MDIQNTNPNILVTYYNGLINIQRRNRNLYTEDKSDAYKKYEADINTMLDNMEEEILDKIFLTDEEYMHKCL